MLKRLLCLFGRHSVNRRRVWHDHIDFRTKCESCGTPLLRDTRGWRAFDDDRDAGDGRAVGPHAAETGS